jgi:hypothetical protein
MARPAVVCICGSMRFKDSLAAARVRETLAGKIVVASEVDFKLGFQFEQRDVIDVATLKTAMDELHLRKIDIADEVLFLNVGNYWGESTTRELRYARALGKRLRFLEPGPFP